MKKIPRFILVGIANTLLGLGTIFLAMQFYPPLVANAIGYLVVVPTSFMTHRAWSFQDEGALAAAFFRYVVVILMGYLANRAALEAGISIDANPYVVQCVAIAAHVFVTFLLSNAYVFQQQKS